MYLMEVEMYWYMCFQFLEDGKFYFDEDENWIRNIGFGVNFLVIIFFEIGYVLSMDYMGVNVVVMCKVFKKI